MKQFQLLATVVAAGKKTTFTSHTTKYNSNIFLRHAVWHTFTLFNTGEMPAGTTHSWKYKGPAQIGKMLIVESSCSISSSSSLGQHLEAAHMEYQVTERSSEPVCGPYSGKLLYSETVLMCILTVSMCFKAFWIQWFLDTFIRSCGLRSKPVDTIFPWRILWSFTCSACIPQMLKFLSLTNYSAVTSKLLLRFQGCKYKSGIFGLPSVGQQTGWLK